jgi:hypothetical protein
VFEKPENIEVKQAAKVRATWGSGVCDSRMFPFGGSFHFDSATENPG